MLTVTAAGKRYDVKVTRTAPQAFRLHMGNNHVDIVGRKLNDGGLLIQATPLALFLHNSRSLQSYKTSAQLCS